MFISTKNLILKLAIWMVSNLFVIIAFFFALYVNFFFKRIGKKPRIVWGSDPIINNSYWSKSMQQIGYISETFTTDFYSLINKRSDWDIILSEKYNWIIYPLKPYFAFIECLFKYDLFVLPFNGFFVGFTPVRFLQDKILKLANKKIIVIPYGSDSYVYRRIRSTSTLHGLMMSYPRSSRVQNKIAKNVDYWIKNADVVLPGTMGPDGFGRWDVLAPSSLCIDLNLWSKSIKNSVADGKEMKVVIAHCPNHKGFKGSEFIERAICTLKEEGYSIEYLILEKVQNNEIRRLFNEHVDILVEQIICTGHGFNAIEGMASGLPTISNLENEDYILPFRRWSFFNECPLVSGTPENLVDVLRKLISRPELRRELGRAGREYVEKYHGFDSAQYLFTNIINYIYGKKDSLINLYHPIFGDYTNRSPKIKHPLVNNRIID